MSSGRDDDHHDERHAVAPWDSGNATIIWGWAVLVAIAALAYPLLLIFWSHSILAAQLTRQAG